MIYFFRIRSAQLDLLAEVNDRLPYTLRYDAYSMNPLTAFRVWHKHKLLFPTDTGERRRVKRFYAIWAASFLLFAAAAVAIVFT